MKKIPILLISLLSILFMFNINNTVNAAGTIGTSGGVSGGGGGSGNDFNTGLYAQYGELLTIQYTTGSGNKYVSIPASFNRYAGVGNYKREYNLKADWAYLTAPYLRAWDTDGLEGESDHGGTAWYSWPFLERIVLSPKMGLVGKGLRLPPRGGIVGNAARYLRSKGGVIDPNGCWHWNGQRVDLVCTWGGETPPPPSYQDDSYREVIVRL